METGLHDLLSIGVFTLFFILRAKLSDDLCGICFSHTSTCRSNFTQQAKDVLDLLKCFSTSRMSNWDARFLLMWTSHGI